VRHQSNVLSPQQAFDAEYRVCGAIEEEPVFLRSLLIRVFDAGDGHEQWEGSLAVREMLCIPKQHGAIPTW
jgi:hypothetical protein